MPHWMIKGLRFIVETKLAENFGDGALNGEERFLKKFVKDSSVIFDVGANRGMWTSFVLKYNPKVTVHAFEPLQEEFQRLTERHIKGNVICNPLGLSDAESREYMDPGSQSLHRKDQSTGNFQQVQLTTLDLYCKRNMIEHIDLLKIDTEGHDMAIIRGATEMINKAAIKRIQFEYSGFNIYAGVLLKDFFDFFENRPYHMYQIYPGTLRRIDQYDPRLENFVYKNFVLIHHSVTK